MIFRRRRLPAELRPPLAPGERVVAWAPTPSPSGRPASGSSPSRGARLGEEPVVATNLGLFLPGYERRFGWHELHKASWTGRELTLIPAEVVAERPGYRVMADRPPVTVTVTDPGDLPQVVRTRLTRSVSFSSHHRVPGGGVRVVARRVPGVDGLSWAVRYDEGTDPDAPGVADATARLVEAHAAAHRTA